MTRSRPHHKNDQAWIEPKNGAVIRSRVGHERFSGLVTGQARAQLLAAVRLDVNYFQPAFKLRARIRVGAKVKKSYPPPATPCDRLLAHAGVEETVQTALRTERDQLDPVALLHRIRQGQSDGPTEKHPSPRCHENSARPGDCVFNPLDEDVFNGSTKSAMVMVRERRMARSTWCRARALDCR